MASALVIASMALTTSTYTAQECLITDAPLVCCGASCEQDSCLRQHMKTSPLNIHINLFSNISNSICQQKQEVLVSTNLGLLFTLTVLSASFSFFLEFFISSLLSSSSSVPTTSQKTMGPESIHGIVTAQCSLQAALCGCYSVQACSITQARHSCRMLESSLGLKLSLKPKGSDI